MTTPLADDAITALRQSHDALVETVARLEPADLDRTSGSRDWDVAQVLSHLGSGAEISLAVLQAALDGSPSPSGEFNQSVWDRWDAMDNASKAAGFGPADEALVSALESLDAGTRESLSIQWFMPADVTLFAGMRLNEVLHHAWDVRVATDPAAGLDASGVEPMLDIVLGPASFLLGFQGKPEGWAHGSTVLRVQTTEPVRDFGLSIGEAVAVTGVADAPDAVLSGAAESVLRLFTGRGESADLSVDGTISLDDLRALFPGF